jgi:hypothetical protein
MNIRNQRLCVWSGLVFAFLFFVGFGVIARFIPPPSPSEGSLAVATMYRHHASGIRLGMVISMFGLVFWVPFVAAISVQLKRIEGPHCPLTYAELGLGATLPVAFMPALYFFETAAFRLGRAPQLIQTLNDMGWLPFTGIIYGIFLENIVIALVIFSDDRPMPIYPRWVAIFNLVCAALYCPACLDVFSTHGSLAWNGLWSWWLSLVSFFVWLIVMMRMTLKAIKASGSDLMLQGTIEDQMHALRVELADVRSKLDPSLL